MSMSTQNFGKQLDRSASPDGPVGAGVCATAGGTDTSDNTGADKQSPASLPLADPAKQSNASTNDGGKTQSPVTGWLNTKKVVATFDGTTPSTKVK